MWEDTAAGNRHTYGESHTGGDRRRCGNILKQGTDIHTESHTQGETGEDVGRYCSREQTYIRRVTHRGRQEKMWEDTAAGNIHTYGESHTGGDRRRYGKILQHGTDIHTESHTGEDTRRCGKILQQGTDIHTKSHTQGETGEDVGRYCSREQTYIRRVRHKGRQEKMWEDTAAGNRHTYGESRTGGDRRRCGKILQQGTDIHTESHAQGDIGEDVGRYCSMEQTYIRRVTHRGRH